ncbi:hypothetical protein N9Y92_01130 [Chlamydiales bacterium]|nr:hypothetical protein [Chlamydiales bacterium]
MDISPINIPRVNSYKTANGMEITDYTDGIAQVILKGYTATPLCHPQYQITIGEKPIITYSKKSASWKELTFFHIDHVMIENKKNCIRISLHRDQQTPEIFNVFKVSLSGA